MKTFLAIFVLALTTSAILARQLDRCSLAREFSFRTDAVGNNPDGSTSNGIFQLNDLYWCQPSNGKFSHNKCGSSCEELRQDDITKSLRCAQKILGEQGWSAWSSGNSCNASPPSIDNCF
ncbi:hypothetical protein M5D96_008064 [Drosophila gunungcola]|uniref:lysozyme n=1 Tax=Drosophila gunungcola TaxID=103775 RepID=A0A9P9YLX3_9MUSC|nr:hypothetical protein M5D96_008064 [Drosophila gunungcola]